MITVTDIQLQQNVQHHLQIATESHEPVMVMHNDRPTHVIMTLDDFASEAATRFFMDRPALHNSLLKSITQIENGQTISTTLEALQPTWADEA